MKRVLIFGFEHFSEFSENPSELLVSHLQGKKIDGKSVTGKILHVDYASVEEEIVLEMDRVDPYLTIGFGLGPGRSRITPEKTAINYRYSSEADNVGKVVKGSRIDENEPDGLFSNLPVEGLVNQLNSMQIPSLLSTSAGGYLCNNAMFIIVREAKRRGSLGGFVHVPCHSEWIARSKTNYASLPLDTIIKGAEASISYCLKNSITRDVSKTLA